MQGDSSAGAPEDLEGVDLAALTRELLAHVAPELLQDYLPGKTAVRDAVMDKLQCSMLHAEYLVDALEARGFLRFQPAQSDEEERGHWELLPG